MHGQEVSFLIVITKERECIYLFLIQQMSSVFNRLNRTHLSHFVSFCSPEFDCCLIMAQLEKIPVREKSVGVRHATPGTKSIPVLPYE